MFDVLIARFYNATNGQCSKFKYTGCAGNKNNFPTESECMEVSVTCDLGHVTRVPVQVCRGGGDTTGGRFTRLQSLALVRSPDYGDTEDILLGDDPEVADRSADCQVTKFLHFDIKSTLSENPYREGY